MKTTTKTASILSLVSFLALGFAGAARAGEGAPRKGQVNVPAAAAAKAVIAGPVAVKVYSGFSGAKIFIAAAASGTDADCGAGAARATASVLPKDRVATVSVGPGQIACVASSGANAIELLWHVQSDAPATAIVANR